METEFQKKGKKKIWIPGKSEKSMGKKNLNSKKEKKTTTEFGKKTENKSQNSDSSLFDDSKLKIFVMWTELNSIRISGWIFPLPASVLSWSCQTHKYQRSFYTWPRWKSLEMKHGSRRGLRLSAVFETLTDKININAAFPSTCNKWIVKLNCCSSSLLPPPPPQGWTCPSWWCPTLCCPWGCLPPP